MTNEKKVTEIMLKHMPYTNPTINTPVRDALQEIAKWKDEQINLLLDAIDYAYLKTDGTYGDLALVVADKVEYLKSLRHGKIE